AVGPLEALAVEPHEFAGLKPRARAELARLLLSSHPPVRAGFGQAEIVEVVGRHRLADAHDQLLVEKLLTKPELIELGAAEGGAALNELRPITVPASALGLFFPWTMLLIE